MYLKIHILDKYNITNESKDPMTPRINQINRNCLYESMQLQH